MWLAGADRYRSVTGRHGFSWWPGGVRWVDCPELPEGLLKLSADPLVFFGEFPIAVVGGFQSAQEGGFGRALPGRHRCARRAVAPCSQLLDLGADVGLGVEPGAGDLAWWATVSKVTGPPVWSSSRSARMALARVNSCRRWAAVIKWAVLSARIGDLLPLASGGVAGVVEAGDDPVEITEDLLVHLGQSLLAAGFGGGDDPQDLAAMLAVLGQKLRCCHKHRASQARVGVRTAFLNGQTAIAIRQCLGDTAESLLGPGSLGQRPVGVQGDGLTARVDLAGGFPVPADRGVVQP